MVAFSFATQFCLRVIWLCGWLLQWFVLLPLLVGLMMLDGVRPIAGTVVDWLIAIGHVANADKENAIHGLTRVMDISLVVGWIFGFVGLVLVNPMHGIGGGLFYRARRSNELPWSWPWLKRG